MIKIDPTMKVLVFAAHPDDEVIGCGATISKLTRAGVKVIVCYVTGGGTGYTAESATDDLLAGLVGVARERTMAGIRLREAREVCDVLGAHPRAMPWHCNDVHANDREIFFDFIRTIRDVKPDLILTHWAGDKHRDHQAINELTVEAAWKAEEDVLPQLGKTHKVRDVWAYEVTDPMPNPDFVVEVLDEWEDKLKAYDLYRSQQDVVGLGSELMEGIAAVRGYQHSPYVFDKAEAFMRATSVPMEVFR